MHGWGNAAPRQTHRHTRGCVPFIFLQIDIVALPGLKSSTLLSLVHLASSPPFPSRRVPSEALPASPTVTMTLDAYTYVFAIGTIFALLEAYNNGAST